MDDRTITEVLADKDEFVRLCMHRRDGAPMSPIAETHMTALAVLQVAALRGIRKDLSALLRAVDALASTQTGRE